MIWFKVIGIKKVRGNLNKAANQLPSLIEKKMRKIVKLLAGYVKMKKLRGQVLHVRTGHLMRSITGKVERSGDTVIGRVGTNVSYGRLWELGGVIPAHTIKPKYAKALHFYTKNGTEVFCKKAEIPERRVKPRPFLRPALKEKKQKIIDMLGEITAEIQ